MLSFKTLLVGSTLAVAVVLTGLASPAAAATQDTASYRWERLIRGPVGSIAACQVKVTSSNGPLWRVHVRYYRTQGVRAAQTDVRRPGAKGYSTRSSRATATWQSQHIAYHRVFASVVKGDRVRVGFRHHGRYYYRLAFAPKNLDRCY